MRTKIIVWNDNSKGKEKEKRYKIILSKKKNKFWYFTSIERRGSIKSTTSFITVHGIELMYFH